MNFLGQDRQTDTRTDVTENITIYHAIFVIGKNAATSWRLFHLRVSVLGLMNSNDVK